jgi:hypothetical protein
MRTRIALISFTVVCALAGASHSAFAGQQPKYGVSVKASKPAALAKAKTYTWTVSQPSFNKDADRQIIAAVDKELQARGLTKAATGGDLAVTYASMSRTDVDVKSSGKNGELPQYPVGTLVVDVRNPANKQSLFRVRMDTPITTNDSARLEAEINAAVAAMFAKYPAPK